jgi:hypothetical protein
MKRIVFVDMSASGLADAHEGDNAIHAAPG